MDPQFIPATANSGNRELTQLREAVDRLADAIAAVRKQRTCEFEKGAIPGGFVIPELKQAFQRIQDHPTSKAAIEAARSRLREEQIE